MTRQTHPNRLSSGAAYAVTLFLFFWFGMLKRDLVVDPVACMTHMVPVVVLLQTGYCLVGKLDELHQAPKKTGKKHDETLSMGSKMSSIVLATILSLILSVLVLVLLVLFGAPLMSLLPETTLCAVHISLLSVMPLVFVYNLDSQTWRDIISVKLPLNGVYGGAVGTWLGAWLGAIPIPLDWDESWQRWPVTILAGAYYGTCIGTVVGSGWSQYKSSIVANTTNKRKKF